jgi:hypothetical protein
MSGKKLLQSNSVHRYPTNRQELTDIRRLVARDLADAAIAALSEDGRLYAASDSEDANRLCRIQSRKCARPP